MQDFMLMRPRFAEASFFQCAGSVEEWMAWQQGVNGGMRRPLGLDYSKRRYWALGGRAACWRVYVEEPETGQWGWYEGERLTRCQIPAHLPLLVLAR